MKAFYIFGSFLAASLGASLPVNEDLSENFKATDLDSDANPSAIDLFYQKNVRFSKDNLDSYKEALKKAFEVTAKPLDKIEIAPVAEPVPVVDKPVPVAEKPAPAVHQSVPVPVEVSGVEESFVPEGLPIIDESDYNSNAERTLPFLKPAKQPANPPIPSAFYSQVPDGFPVSPSPVFFPVPVLFLPNRFLGFNSYPGFGLPGYTGAPGFNSFPGFGAPLGFGGTPGFNAFSEFGDPPGFSNGKNSGVQGYRKFPGFEEFSGYEGYPGDYPYGYYSSYNNGLMQKELPRKTQKTSIG